MTLSRTIEHAMTAEPQIEELAAQLQPILQDLEDRLPRQVMETLRGEMLGHPLHPVLVHLPLGGWMLAGILDHWQGQDEKTERAADLVLTLATVGAVPTVAAGWAEWSDLKRQPRRTGLVHGLLEETALVLNVASLVARKRGKRGLGKALSGTGLGLALLGGLLGGELVYGHGVGVRR